jgi:hypothetical protein
MKQALGLFLLTLVSGCATFGIGGRDTSRTSALWRDSHYAYYRGDLIEARQGFARLAAEEPESGEGHEALFFLGAIALDPRNPEWNPAPAERRLRDYLAVDSAGASGFAPRPEARTLLALAEQLNLPADRRVAALRPAETPPTAATPERPPPRQVVVPAARNRELAAEVERLRQELAARDETIRRLQDELTRIRRTLNPRRP